MANKKSNKVESGAAPGPAPARRAPEPEAAPATDRTPLGEEGGHAISDLLRDRVREMRKKRGWTLEQLSVACGVSRSMLSQIERGQANPTLGVAYRIAQAFGLALGEMIDAPSAASKIETIRAGDRKHMFRSDRGVRIRTLSPLHLEKDVEFYEVRLRPGGALRSAAHFAGTSEFLAVEQGSIRIRAAEDACELHQGDSAHYPADVPHAIENTGTNEAVVFLVDIYR